MQDDFTILKSRRILVLLKLDAQRLFERLRYRAPEYIGIFALQRTRDHFTEIFRNRYQFTTINDLSYCNEDAIFALDNFYSRVDDLNWYLNTTQDMPNAVEDSLERDLKELEVLYDTVVLNINIQLGILPFSPKEDTKSQLEAEMTQETITSTADEIPEISDIIFETSDNLTNEES